MKLPWWAMLILVAFMVYIIYDVRNDIKNESSKPQTYKSQPENPTEQQPTQEANQDPANSTATTNQTQSDQPNQSETVNQQPQIDIQPISQEASSTTSATPASQDQGFGSENEFDDSQTKTQTLASKTQAPSIFAKFEQILSAYNKMKEIARIIDFTNHIVRIETQDVPDDNSSGKYAVCQSVAIIKGKATTREGQLIYETPTSGLLVDMSDPTMPYGIKNAVLAGVEGISYEALIPVKWFFENEKGQSRTSFLQSSIKLNPADMLLFDFSIESLTNALVATKPLVFFKEKYPNRNVNCYSNFAIKIILRNLDGKILLSKNTDIIVGKAKLNNIIELALLNSSIQDKLSLILTAKDVKTLVKDFKSKSDSDHLIMDINVLALN